MSEEIIEGTAIEPVHPPENAVNLFGTTDPTQVLARAAEVADALVGVIRRKRLYTNIRGKSHVQVGGWQLLGSMLGVTAVCTETEDIGNGYKATVEARTLDGRVVGRADALCTRGEKSGPWKTADDYALLSMAQTRATSKALRGPLGFVIQLAGYEPTPAEEMPSDAAQEPNPEPEPDDDSQS